MLDERTKKQLEKRIALITRDLRPHLSRARYDDEASMQRLREVVEASTKKAGFSGEWFTLIKTLVQAVTVAFVVYRASNGWDWRLVRPMIKEVKKAIKASGVVVKWATILQGIRTWGPTVASITLMTLGVPAGAMGGLATAAVAALSSSSLALLNGGGEPSNEDLVALYTLRALREGAGS
jgi:hypothetical protein